VKLALSYSRIQVQGSWRISELGVADRHRYTARACRRKNWWLVSVPEVPGALTPVPRLIDAERMARQVISRVLDVPGDSFAVIVDA
jgi:hypothetical protein